MNLEDLLKPGTMSILQHQHDDGCKTMKSQNMADCTCKEVKVVVVPLETDEDFEKYMEEFG